MPSLKHRHKMRDRLSERNEGRNPTLQHPERPRGLNNTEMSSHAQKPRKTLPTHPASEAEETGHQSKGIVSRCNQRHMNIKEVFISLTEEFGA